MKRTVIYKIVDGLKIITGFDKPTVDPVETAKIVDEAIKDTPEYQAAEAKKAEYSQAVQDMVSAKKAKDDTKYNLATAAMAVRQEELKPIADDLAAKIKDLRRSEAVYFEPRTGEVIMDASDVDGLLQSVLARSKGTFIALDGSVVENNRGCVFFRKSGGKWGRSQIVKLGDKVPGDAVLESDVTDTQRHEIEKDRVSALAESEKATERTRAMQGAIDSAADMRSRLEIMSDPKALEKSQAAYQAEVDRIKGLYG